ncbi:HAD family hydrolase [Ideonella benzenivorans]|uniref:HAD family hydrolase n=1 Tax=Ideonella benzenivorans TaxID=2831643 RepID=UPI001CECA492|nr:HAD family phosphatase [Ideonella benzenivorans]
MPMPAPHFIFDFGGVVFQWRPADLLARVLPHRICSAEEAEHWKRTFFQAYQGDWGAFDSGLISAEECRDRIAARTGLSRDEVQTVIDAVPQELAPQADTVALLQALKAAGHRLFFLSNMPEPYAHYLETHHAFLAWFEDGVFSARVKTGKPGLDIFRIALARFGLAPAEALFIDDHPENIAAAGQLGLPALQFTTAPRLLADLRAQGLALDGVLPPVATAALN